MNSFAPFKQRLSIKQDSVLRFAAALVISLLLIIFLADHVKDA